MHATRKSLIAAAISVAAISGAAAPASAAPIQFSKGESLATDVAAWGGYVAWTSFDVASKEPRLMLSRSGESGEVQNVTGGLGAATPRLDVGPGEGGATYIAFPRGGRITLVDTETASVTTIKGARPVSGPVAVYGKRIAYLAGAKHPELRIETAGARRATVIKRDIRNFDLGATHVAFVEREGTGTGSVWTLHLRNLETGRDQVLARVGYGGASWGQVTKPAITADGKQVVWAETRVGAGTGNRVMRYTLRTGKLEQARGSARYFATAWGSNEAGLIYSTAMDPVGAPECVEDNGEAPTQAQLDDSLCKVASTGKLDFRPAKSR